MMRGFAAAIVCTVAISAAAVPNDDRTIAHVLNRLAFGARPGDVDRVRQMGLEHYIRRQLEPDRVADPAIDARLAQLTTVKLTNRDIADRFERPLMEARRARKQNDAADQNAQGAPKAPDPVQRRANSVVVELGAQKILRAVDSERQLQEVLTDFWFNHFNVDARKGRDRFMLTEYERETIRPHVLGRFRDLIGATAKSPAMLFYLDNWMSADPDGPHGPMLRQRLQARKNAPRGLNENYGRELMELHTLGVDGGYTQKDVTEVARAFTGWTIENPRQGGGFIFRPQLHDMGQKVVLGHVIRGGGGQSDGEQVLDMLTAHPSTARFIAAKLVRRFVADDPPAALVERAAERFRKTGGDLRETVRTILTSREFLAADAIDAKARTPFEFVVAALRATGADVPDARPFVRTLQQLGMPLYQCQPPTGYKDTADAWINTGALVARMNVATRLADGDGELASRLGSPEFQRR